MTKKPERKWLGVYDYVQKISFIYYMTEELDKKEDPMIQGE